MDGRATAASGCPRDRVARSSGGGRPRDDHDAVATEPDGEPARFSGSTTGRARVREIIGASFRSRYADRPVPSSVAAAENGVATEARARVFEP